MGPSRHGRWAVALGLTLVVALFPQFALGALGPQLRVQLGVGPADLGLVFGGLYAVGVLGAPIAGVLVDRIGGRRSCIGLMAVACVALLGASMAQGRTALIVAMVPAGAAMAFSNPSTNRWASAAPSPAVQARLVGVAQAGVQAGALTAGLLAASVAIGLDWRGALRIGAILAVAGVAVAMRAPTDAPDRTAPRARTSARAASPRVVDDGHGVDPADGGRTRRVSASAPAQRRTQVAVGIYALTMGMGTSVVFAYLPSYGVDVVGLSVAAAGATAVVFGGTALVCRLALGATLKRPDELAAPLLVAMAIGAAVSIVLLAMASRATGWIWVGAVLFGATGTTWPAVAFLAALRASPPRESGRVAGWVAAAFYLGMWVSPPIAGWAIATFGYRPVWVGAVMAYATATVPAARAKLSG